MSRLWTYTGSPNTLTFAAGALAGQSRPLSMAWLLRPTTGGGNGDFGGIFNVRTSGNGDIWTLLTDGAYFSLPNSTGQSQYAATWTYVGLDIPTSTGGQIRWHFWREDTGSWTHTNGGTISLSGTIHNVLLGFWDGGHFAGLIAAGGFWLSALGDAGHEANGVTALQDWADNSPAILWSFESAGTIEDLTGGGADQTASAGSTSESSTELAGWSYAISAGEDHEGSGAACSTTLTPATGTGAPAAAGSGVGCSTTLTPGPGVGSPAVTGVGSPVTAVFTPASGTGTPHIAADGGPAQLVLTPGTGSGTAEQPGQGSGLLVTLTLAPELGSGTPALTGAGQAAQLALGPAAGVGATAVVGSGVACSLTLTPGLGQPQATTGILTAVAPLLASATLVPSAVPSTAAVPPRVPTAGGVA